MASESGCCQRVANEREGERGLALRSTLAESSAATADSELGQPRPCGRRLVLPCCQALQGHYVLHLARGSLTALLFLVPANSAQSSQQQPPLALPSLSSSHPSLRPSSLSPLRSNSPASVSPVPELPAQVVNAFPTRLLSLPTFVALAATPHPRLTALPLLNSYLNPPPLRPQCALPPSSSLLSLPELYQLQATLTKTPTVATSASSEPGE